MKVLKLIVLLCSLFVFLGCDKSFVQAEYDVIPLPQNITPGSGGDFLLNEQTKIVYTAGNDVQMRTASFLAEYIRLATSLNLSVTDQAQDRNAIILKTDNLADAIPESYRLTVNEETIEIAGADEAGVFYGVQTLRKSIPPDNTNHTLVFPPVHITDYPRFAYRGMHLDVCRHLFPVGFIKQYIDLLALHNINRFHWHITDDQGWRIEIKKYPELTQIGSMRDETVIGRNSGEYDGTPYGGYFTQEEAREIVAYAEERFITVIPEVDLPGHMLAALTAFPHLGCTGGPYKVAQTWGVFDDVLCAGSEEVYTFLEDVFTEIIDVFPSEYIHIGGDECPKTRWEQCPRCQAKIKTLGIQGDAQQPAEFKLQTYAISRIENFLNNKGRQIIGWDEILEGGLAPHATLMSWRGMEGGVEAARQGHQVIMVPNSHCYFDYYPTKETGNEPLAIGNYIPLEKVYDLEPVPAELSDKEKKFIIGAQANLWTEYVLSPEHVEYMVLPRMAALSEVQWTEPEKKDYTTFLPRAYRMTQLYDRLGYNYGTHAFDIQAEDKIDLVQRTISVTLSCFDHAPVYFTLDGTTPTAKSQAYDQPIVIDSTTQLRAVAIRDGKPAKEYQRLFNFHKATLKDIRLESPTHKNYTYDGAVVLVDGKRGGSSHNSGQWLGFYNTDFVAIIDLGESTEVSSVTTGTLWAAPSWIFGAESYTVYLSDNGTDFHEVYSEEYPALTATSPEGVNFDLTATFQTQPTRYVKLAARSTQPLPDWHVGKGHPAFLFVDEIIVE